MKRILITVVIILVSTLFFNRSYPENSFSYQYNSLALSGEVGEKAAEFELYTLSGEKLKLSDYSGKVVILDFWATWCPPCRKGIPDLIDLQKSFKDELVVIGISLDQPSARANLEAFIKQYGINYHVVLGNVEVAMAYGNIQAIPTSFVLNRKGVIVNKFVGLVNKSEYKKIIEELTKTK